MHAGQALWPAAVAVLLVVYRPQKPCMWNRFGRTSLNASATELLRQRNACTVW